jgi:hypothetical protein
MGENLTNQMVHYSLIKMTNQIVHILHVEILLSKMIKWSSWHLSKLGFFKLDLSIKKSQEFY